MNYSAETEVGQHFYKVPSELFLNFSDKIVHQAVLINKLIRLDISADVYVLNPLSDEGFSVEGDTCTTQVSPDTMGIEVNEYLQYIEEVFSDEDTHPLAEGLRESGLTIIGTMGYLYINVTYMNGELFEVMDEEVDDNDQQDRIGTAPRRQVKAIGTKKFYWACYYARKEMKTPGRYNTRDRYFEAMPEIDSDNKFITDNQARILMSDANKRVFMGIRWVVVNRFLKPIYSFDYRHADRGENARGATRVLQYDTTKSTWRYVFDLSLLRHPANYRFCNPCGIFHHNNKKNCWKNIGGIKYANKYKRFQKPPADLVFYGDFEAYNSEDGQKISGFCLANNKNDVKYLEDSLEPVEYGWQVNRYLLSQIPHFDQVDVKYNNPNVEGEEIMMCDICDANHQGFYYRAKWFNIPESRDEIEILCESHWMSCGGVIPIYFHNSTKYDVAHIYKVFISNLTADQVEQATFIAKSINRVETCTFPLPGTHYHIQIRDSCKQVANSLANIASIYTPDLPKGVFPYDWFDSLGKLADRQLPDDDEAWFSNLSKVQQDKRIAQQIWEEKGFETMRDYHNYYLEQDVYILKTFMEKYRKDQLEVYGADPARFNGIQALSWYTCRADMHTNEKEWMSLPPDNIKKQCYETFWGSIRGGITNCITRYANVDEGGQILYLDVNGLYGSVLQDKKYPIGETIRYNEITDMETFMRSYVDNVEMYGDETPHGFAATVDITFPDEIHDQQPMPLCEQKLETGLINSFEPIVAQLHSMGRIRQMIACGIQIAGVHDVWTWNHVHKYRAHITKAIDQRAIAREEGDEGRATASKMMGNAIFGKTIESPKKYKEYSLGVPDRANIEQNVIGIQNLLATLTFNGEPVQATIRRPIETKVQNHPWDGFMVLEYSKERFYNGVQKITAYPGTELLYCDTDSVIVFNKEENFYENLKAANEDLIVEDKEYGKWQLETPPDEILEFLGVSQKAYYLHKRDGRDLKTHKGVDKHSNLTRDMYYNCIFNHELIEADQVQLRINLDNVYIKQFRKIALNSKNSKRIILVDKVHSIPYGYNGLKYNPFRQPNRDIFP